MATFKQKCKVCGDLKQCVKADGVRKCSSCLTPDDKAWLYEKKKTKAKGYNKTSRNNAIAKLKPTGEGALHVKLWLSRPHACTGCDRKLYVMEPTIFSHTIRKAEREDLILEEQNIEIECYDCHHIWDKGTWDKIMKQKNFTRRMEYIKVTDPDLYGRKALKILDYTGVDLTI